MKKIIAWLLVLALSVSAVGVSFAEEDAPEEIPDLPGSFFSDVVNGVSEWATGAWGDASEWAIGAWDDASQWATGAWNDASQWATGAWNDASRWIDLTWGDASKWISGTWNDSTAWITEIWGDASSRAKEFFSGASGTISAWWTETFGKVTETSENAWEWMKKTVITYKDKGLELFGKVKEAILSEDSVRTVFYVVLEEFGMSDADADKIWNTLDSFAQQEDVSADSVFRIALPYLLQLEVDGEEDGGGSVVPSFIIAQFLTAVLEKLGADDPATASTLVNALNITLHELG